MEEGPEVLVFGGARDAVDLLGDVHQAKLPVTELRKNLDAFMLALKDMLPSVDSAGSGFGLKSLSVAVGINGKGQVGFLGTGAEVGGDASLTLTFERS
jgi:hypothetical protein